MDVNILKTSYFEWLFSTTGFLLTFGWGDMYTIKDPTFDF